MVNISEIFIFLNSKFFASNKICFSSSVNGEAIANAFIVSSKLCFSNSFQLITKPLFSNNNLRSLNIFAFVKADISEGTNINTKVLDIEVKEKPTGEIMAGAGVGTGGGSFAFGGRSLTEAG